MSDSKLVSVIVPFLDSERTLADCIESLLGQVGVEGRFEILLVDNGSTDRSRTIAKRFGTITLLEESKPGAYAARNAALRRATAPVIAFTDADCAVDRDWLQAILEAMAQPEVGVAVGHCRYPDDASLALRLLGIYENAKTDYVLNRSAPAHHFAYANNMAVRASVFAELGPFKEWKRAADSELVHRLAASRPDSRLVYCSSMRVTHLEFRRARERARRLSLYTRTNAKIGTFRELGLRERLALLPGVLRALWP